MRSENIKNALTERVHSLLTHQTQSITSDIRIDKLAYVFLSHISSVDINPFDAYSRSIVSDFITDKNYIDIYYTCLVDSNQRIHDK